MIRLQPYPMYKNSGVPWLEENLAHWQALPNRALFAEVNDRNYPDEPLLSVTIGKGVIRQSELLANNLKKDSPNENKANYRLALPRKEEMRRFLEKQMAQTLGPESLEKPEGPR